MKNQDRPNMFEQAADLRRREAVALRRRRRERVRAFFAKVWRYMTNRLQGEVLSSSEWNELAPLVMPCRTEYVGPDDLEGPDTLNKTRARYGVAPLAGAFHTPEIRKGMVASGSRLDWPDYVGPEDVVYVEPNSLEIPDPPPIRHNDAGYAFFEERRDLDPNPPAEFERRAQGKSSEGWRGFFERRRKD